jgi:diguanylate cyclase (GGDEF)-like protein
MFMKTNLSLNNWLPDICQDIFGSVSDNTAPNWMQMVFAWLLGKTHTLTTIQEMLHNSDRRKPAYAQLRNAWDRLDRTSQAEVVDWILLKTMTDPLSGLETLVAREVSGQIPEGWVEAISDLNALKAINDTWGHNAGDDVIRGLGRIVKAEVMKAGGRAFRVGGDEVGCWFPNLQIAEQTLEAIDAKFQAEVFVLGNQKRTGFSLSYGIGPDISAADQALYRDKERRKALGQRSERGQLPGSIGIAT